MKVIVAAFPKCGTKTMAMALRELDYSVYDAMENYEYLHKDWENIFLKGGNIKDFQRMYKNVDACTDVPSCYFWEELLEAFPDSKIILIQRSSENVWWRSIKGQILSSDSIKFRLIGLLSPTYSSVLRYSRMMGDVIFGCGVKRPSIGSFKFNELLFRKSYRRHNSYILQKAPKEKLLIFKLEDGWKPLCEFLDKPIPSKPFPHENKKASISKKLMNKDPTFQRIKKEVVFSTTIMSALISYICYRFLH